MYNWALANAQASNSVQAHLEQVARNLYGLRVIWPGVLAHMQLAAALPADL